MSLPTDHEQQLEIGRHAHEKTFGSIKETARYFGIAEHQIYPLQSQYRAAHGIVSATSEHVRASQAKRLATRRANAAAAAGNKAAAAEAKKERDRVRHKAAREAKRQAKLNGHSNGHGQHLAVVPDTSAIAQRVNDLQAQLDHAMEEMHTLQKILMTVGKAL